MADWEVVYCSVPTSPGGIYRTPLGRLVFKTDDMVQVVEAPDVVRNKVSFSIFGLDGEVSLKGESHMFGSTLNSMFILRILGVRSSSG